MPVNLAILDANLRTVEQQAVGDLNAPRILSQLEVSLKSLRDTAVQTEPNTIEIPSHNTLEFAQAGLNAKLSPRQWRHATIKGIESLIEQLNEAHPNNQAELARINQAHKWNADIIREVCAYDVDPIRVIPFRQTPRGRDTLIESANEALKVHGNNIRKGRAHINQRITEALADNLQQYIDEQFPVAIGRTEPPRLSERDILVLGKDIWGALEQRYDTPAAETATLLTDGCSQNRWQIENHFLTSGYWSNAWSIGFEQALPSHSELLASTRVQDQILAWDALEIVRASSSRFEFNPNRPVVQYVEDGDHHSISQLKELRQQGTSTRIAVAPDRNGAPLIIAPWSADTPNHYLITAPWKLYQIIRIGDDVEGKDRLDIFQRAAEELENNRGPQWVETQIRELNDEWLKLPTGDPKYLKDGLLSIRGKLQELATHLPPPGHGNKEQMDAARNLVKLMSVMPNEDSHKTYLTFRLPAHRGTCPYNQKPNVFVDRQDIGDGNSDITWHKISDSGIVSPQSFETMRNIPNLDASSTIAKAGLKYSHTYGTLQPGAPGFNVHTPSESGMSPYVGHWMTPEERQALTHRSIASLSTLIAGDNAPALRNVHEAELAAYAIVELAYGLTITSEQANNVFDGLIFDGDLILDAGSNNPGQAFITLPATLTRVATPDEIKASLSQQIALSKEVSPTRAQEIIDNIQETSWEHALEAAQFMTDMDFSPGIRI